MRYVAIDVSKAKADITIRHHEGQILERVTLSNDSPGFQELEKRLEKGDRLGVEACTRAYSVHDAPSRGCRNQWGN